LCPEIAHLFVSDRFFQKKLPGKMSESQESKDLRETLSASLAEILQICKENPEYGKDAAKMLQLIVVQHSENAQTNRTPRQPRNTASKEIRKECKRLKCAEPNIRDLRLFVDSLFKKNPDFAQSMPKAKAEIYEFLSLHWDDLKDQVLAFLGEFRRKRK
jgi:hypothetical protein